MYATDITRTYPVNGRFSPEQKAIYEIVLDAQKQAMAIVKPGIRRTTRSRRSARSCRPRGSSSSACSPGDPATLDQEPWAIAGSRSTASRTGSGLDVHDAGGYGGPAESRASLEPGMVFTIEPGIYIPAEHAGRRPEVVEHRRADRGHGPRHEGRPRLPLVRCAARRRRGREDRPVGAGRSRSPTDGVRRTPSSRPAGPSLRRRSASYSTGVSARADASTARSRSRRGRRSASARTQSPSTCTSTAPSSERIAHLACPCTIRREPVLQVARRGRRHQLKELRELAPAAVREEQHVEVVGVESRVGRDDPPAGVVPRAAGDREGRRVRRAVDRHLEARKVVPQELEERRRENADPAEQRFQAMAHVPHDSRVDARRPPTAGRAGRRHARAAASRRYSVVRAATRRARAPSEYRARWRARWTCRPAAPRAAPPSPRGPQAASEIVPSPPQTATTSSPRARNVRTMEVASPGPLVGALTSSRPRCRWRSMSALIWPRRSRCPAVGL